MQLNLKATNVLKRTIQADREGYKIIIEEGGSRSSKTWSVLQFLILEAYAGRQLTYTIARSKLTWIKSTLLKDFELMVRLYNLPVTPEINFNRAEQVYNLMGSEFAFFGLDYAQKLHGRSQDRFWINECIEATKMDFDQLEMRTRIGGFVDYNPVEQVGSEWVYDLQKRPDAKLIHSTMLDNPFLPEQIITKIKSYEPNETNIKNGTADDFMWQVYGLGKKAKLKGLVFTNWDIVDNVPTEATLLGYGLDFGYTNDPTALVALYKMNNELYIKQLIYESGLTNKDIADRFAELNLVKEVPIYADSSEPKSIQELNDYGWAALATVKGADSIVYGIDLLKAFKLHITRDSGDAEKEFGSYKWAEDKSGNSLNVPIGKSDHIIDAVRYIFMMTRPQMYEKQIKLDPWGIPENLESSIDYVPEIVDII